ncbi:MAG: alpha/beta hydrolase [Flavobacterium sp.]|nr:alpha/beta hydrolase [Flavobacterium sp.]
MQKIPVYFVPGLAASSLIYERLKLPESLCECVYLEWEVPLEAETLSDYARRLSEKIVHERPILVGVSMGGIMVQEMSKFIDTRKVVIISSVKSNQEFQPLFKQAKYTKTYRIVPTTLLIHLEKLAKYNFLGHKIQMRLKLYKRYLYMRNKKFWDWAIREIIMWDRSEADPEVVHIHGDQDVIFPSKYIKDFILVPGGTHIMLVIKPDLISQHLTEVIEREALK